MAVAVVPGDIIIRGRKVSGTTFSGIISTKTISEGEFNYEVQRVEQPCWIRQRSAADLDQRPERRKLGFSYDAANRITKITHGLDSSMTQTLGYDALNRLLSVSSGSDHESYSYDADGNRLNAVINGVTWTYTPAAASNRLSHAANGSWSGTYQYDGNGNMLGTSHQYWTYDAFNRMRTATPYSGTPVTTYDVNPEGQRLRKYTSSTHTYFAPDRGGALMAEYEYPHWTDDVRLNGRLVTVMKAGDIYPVHTDQTGRPEAITDAAHDILWRAHNFAFDRTVITDTWGDFNVGFPGQYYDDEVGKWYNGNRDYDSTLGRYIESDPIGLAGGINTYAYVGNNPVSLVDPLGLCPKCSSKLPDGSTIGQHVQAIVASLGPTTFLGDNVLNSITPITTILAVYSGTDFRKTYGGPGADYPFLGEAGNFAYGAVSADIGVPLWATEMAAGGYAHLTHPASQRVGPYGMTNGERVNIPNGYAAKCLNP